MGERAIPIQQRRILAGQCPLCGKEAAPYRLCHEHRQLGRLTRILKRASRYQYFKEEKIGGKLHWSLGPKAGDSEVARQLDKWSTDWNAPETDRRTRPRLRGISVDVEATLVRIIERIGRPCTIEEIKEAWGRLRERRSSPLASDLAVIIAAKDKRERKNRKRASLAHEARA